jgi:rhodanese-related sulfurtransferase/CBS domain-containing protein
MATTVDRQQVHQLINEGAYLVEVLPAAEYADEHLPGAINIPLKELDRDRVRELDLDHPVVVYCYDDPCDLSPRAAARLDSLGFTQVYDYAAGKTDWGSAGLPLEGANASQTRAGAHVRTDVPVCRLADRLRDVCDRLETSGWDTCFVTDERGVVLGRLGRSVIRGREDVSAEEAMTLGPGTIRPSARLADMVERMREKNLMNVPVTTSDGRLVGLLTRQDAEAGLRVSET